MFKLLSRASSCDACPFTVRHQRARLTLPVVAIADEPDVIHGPSKRLRATFGPGFCGDKLSVRTRGQWQTGVSEHPFHSSTEHLMIDRGKRRGRGRVARWLGAAVGRAFGLEELRG